MAKDKAALQAQVREALTFALDTVATFNLDKPKSSAASTIFRHPLKSIQAGRAGYALYGLIQEDLDKKYSTTLRNLLGPDISEKEFENQKQALEKPIAQIQQAAQERDKQLAELDVEVKAFTEIVSVEYSSSILKEKQEEIHKDFKKQALEIAKKAKIDPLQLEKAAELKAQYSLSNVDEILKTNTVKTVLEDSDLWRLLEKEENAAKVGNLLIKFQPQIETQLKSLTLPAAPPPDPAPVQATTVIPSTAVQSTSAVSSTSKLPEPSPQELEEMLRLFEPKDITSLSPAATAVQSTFSASSSSSPKSAASTAPGYRVLSDVQQKATRPSAPETPQVKPMVSSEAYGVLVDQLTKPAALLALTTILAKSSPNIATLLTTSKPLEEFIDRSIGVDPVFVAAVLPTLTDIFEGVQTNNQQDNLRKMIREAKPLITRELGRDGKPVELTPEATRSITVAASSMVFGENGIHQELAEFIQKNPALIIDFMERMKMDQTLKSTTGLDLSNKSHKEFMELMIPVVGDILGKNTKSIEAMVNWANAEPAQPMSKIIPSIKHLLIDAKGPKVLSVVPHILTMHQDAIIDITTHNPSVIAALKSNGVDLNKPDQAEAMKPIFSTALGIVSGITERGKVEEQQRLFSSITELSLAGDNVNLPVYSQKEITTARQTAKATNASPTDKKKAERILRVEAIKKDRAEARDTVSIMRETDAITPEQRTEAEEFYKKLEKEGSAESKALKAFGDISPKEKKEAERITKIVKAAEALSKDDKKAAETINKKIKANKDVTPAEKVKAEAVTKTLEAEKAIPEKKKKDAAKTMEILSAGEVLSEKERENRRIMSAFEAVEAIAPSTRVKHSQTVLDLERRETAYNVSLVRTASATLDLVTKDPDMVTQITSLTSPGNIQKLMPIILTQVTNPAIQTMVVANTDLASKFVSSFVNKDSLPVVADELQANLTVISKIIGPQREKLMPKEVSQLFSSAINVLQHVSTAKFVEENHGALTSLASQATELVSDKQIAAQGFASRKEFDQFAGNTTKIALDTVQTVLTPDNLTKFAALAPSIGVVVSNKTPEEKAPHLQAVAKTALDILKSGVLEKNENAVVAVLNQVGKMTGGLPMGINGKVAFDLLTDPKITEKIGKVVDNQKAMQGLTKATEEFGQGKYRKGTLTTIMALQHSIGLGDTLKLGWKVFKDLRKKPVELAEQPTVATGGKIKVDMGRMDEFASMLEKEAVDVDKAPTTTVSSSQKGKQHTVQGEHSAKVVASEHSTQTGGKIASSSIKKKDALGSHSAKVNSEKKKQVTKLL